MTKKANIFWTDKSPSGPFHYKTANSFYASPPWLRLRAYKLSINPLCERCDQLRNLIVPAGEVHHIKDVDEYPELALEIENTESLCKTCHSQETLKKTNDARRTKSKGGIITLKSKYLNNE